MEKYKLIMCILIIIALLLSACDDFLSPTINIFNEIIAPSNVEQIQQQEQKERNVEGI